MIQLVLFFNLVGFACFVIWQWLLLPAALAPLLLFLFIGMFVAGAVSLLMILFFFRNLRSTPLQWLSKWTSLIEAYFFSFLGVNSFLFIAGLVSFVLITFGFDPVRVARSCLLSAFLLIIFSYWIAMRGPRLMKVFLSEFSTSLRIAQISDLHIGATLGAKYVARLVNIVLSEKPDLIVLTGDIGDGDPELHAQSVKELARLKAPLGVVGVLGNHEHYRGAKEWVRTLNDAGVKILNNELLRMQHETTELTVFGIAAAEREISSVPKIDKNNFYLVLSHYPSHAEAATEAGAHLFLAGHTHGGQFWPWTWVIHFVHRYARGLYKVRNTYIYVSPGSGYWGPPLRLGAPAEVTLLGGNKSGAELSTKF